MIIPHPITAAVHNDLSSVCVCGMDAVNSSIMELKLHQALHSFTRLCEEQLRYELEREERYVLASWEAVILGPKLVEMLQSLARTFCSQSPSWLACHDKMRQCPRDTHAQVRVCDTETTLGRG